MEINHPKDDIVKFKYEKSQLGLEYSFEAATHLMWYFAIDESIYREDNFIHTALQEGKPLTSILMEVITTPIVASACPNMFPFFIEILLQILFSYGADFKAEFLKKIVGNVKMQLENVEKILGDDIAKVDDVESKVTKVNDLTLNECG